MPNNLNVRTKLDGYLQALVNHERDRLFHEGGVPYGLESFIMLMEFLGNPQNTYPVIHVAGSFGKGSTSTYAAALLSNQVVGLATSPHLVNVRERIRINGSLCSEEILCRALKRILETSAKHELSTTYFEALTAASFLIFQEQEVEVAVIEVGLGGRLDATNIVQSEVSVICSIALDHRKVLGDTVELIAEEKAGILKPLKPVVMGPVHGGARSVILNRANASGSPVLDCEETGFEFLPEPMRPWARVAERAVDTLVSMTELTRMPRSVLGRVVMPGRFQTLMKYPQTMLDGGHMPAAIKEAICEAQRVFRGKELCMILGLLADKDADGILDVLAAHRVWPILTQVRNPRSADPESLLKLALSKGPFPRPPILVEKPSEALKRARATLNESGNESGGILIGGSFYLVGEFLDERDVTKLF